MINVKLFSNIVFKFFAFYVILIMVGFIVVRLILRTDNEKDLSTSKKRLFGFLKNLDKVSIFSISVEVVRFAFIIFSLCFRRELSIINLYTLIFLAFLYGVFSKKVSSAIFELIVNLLLYVGIYVSMLLTGYIKEVSFIWYVFLGDIFLLIFLILFSMYFFLKSVNDVVSRTKYIRRSRNE